MKSKTSRAAPSLGPTSARCLKSLLEIELQGEPVDVYEWRARNAKKIPLLEELTKKRMLQTDRGFAVTFWGLMNAPGEAAADAMAKCERLFKALRKHYPAHPKEQIAVEELSRKLKMAPADVLQSARFLARSPIYLGIQGEGSDAKLMPNENYVTLNGFEEIKLRAGDEARRVANAAPLSLALDGVTTEAGLSSALVYAESEAVRESYRKMNERVPSDAAGAITAARALVEAGCKYVIEEHGDAKEKHLELPKLYAEAAALLKLHPRADVSTALRQVLQGSASIVNGLAQLRNLLGDAHGKGTRSARPAKRHAQLAVALATAITEFLLATLDAQRGP